MNGVDFRAEDVQEDSDDWRCLEGAFKEADC